jgi:DNA-binding response OmpR family regulator
MTATCLVGEADPFLARLLERFGEASGLTMVRAKAGQDLLLLARTLKPGVIIVEVELPGTLRGWEAIRAVKSEIALAHIPVITCSWLTQAEAYDLTGDAVAHLQKPDLHYADFTRALAFAGIDSLHQPAAVSDDHPAS